MAANEKSGFWNDWKTKHPRCHQLLVLELCIAGLLIIALIWRFGADGWSLWSENRENVRDLALIIVAIAGVPFVIWREYSTHRSAKAAVRQAEIAADRHQEQTEADRERRIIDSFTKAIELLGKPELEVRLGAIYALERIARESQPDHWPIMETLTAYVRTRVPVQVKAQDASQAAQIYSSNEAVSAYAVAATEGTVEATQASLTEIAVDIQAVLTVLTRRILNHEEKNQRINLSGANLSGAYLSRANLSQANLSQADLSQADLSRANLSGADLGRANLCGAILSRADLGGAWLSGANLMWADLDRANLCGAILNDNLNETDLRGANLDEADLRGAYLSGANLCGAYLGEADLMWADLRKANLTYANLKEANLIGANLKEADLSEANLSGANLSRAIDANLEYAKRCRTIMPDSTVNNRDCPPEEAPPSPSGTPPASN